MRKIYLDDLRDPVDSYKNDPDGWEIYREPLSLIAHLRETRLIGIDLISLDHDLGTVTTGYDVLCAIEGLVYDGAPLPTIWLHSQNPVGVQNMRKALDSIHRIPVAKQRIDKLTI